MSAISRPGGEQRSDRAVSQDGKLRFELIKGDAGVHVERRQQVAQDSTIGCFSIQTLFTTSEEFARFCEADELRFEYPLLFVQVRRAFNELTSPRNH
jgi:hypothetical protein